MIKVAFSAVSSSSSLLLCHVAVTRSATSHETKAHGTVYFQVKSHISLISGHVLIVLCGFQC